MSIKLGIAGNRRLLAGHGELQREKLVANTLLLGPRANCLPATIVTTFPAARSQSRPPPIGFRQLI